MYLCAGVAWRSLRLRRSTARQRDAARRIKGWMRDWMRDWMRRTASCEHTGRLKTGDKGGLFSGPAATAASGGTWRAPWPMFGTGGGLVRWRAGWRGQKRRQTQGQLPWALLNSSINMPPQPSHQQTQNPKLSMALCHIGLLRPKNTQSTKKQCDALLSRLPQSLQPPSSHPQ